MPVASKSNTNQIAFDVQGWDELNLCEFPIAMLGDRAPKGCLELSFNDTVWDDAAQQAIHRKLNISALAKHGLPTAKDEDVLRYMIYITDQKNGFTDPTVHFTHYELIQLLGWNEGTRSYQRITDALHRWRSTELDYQNAWRDPETKSWANANFSILADVVIYDRQERAKLRQSGQKITEPLSYFVWGKTFFKSMQSHYRKRLDLAFLQTLQTGQSKRLYCFLDKRFGTGRAYLDFNLHEFAFEKLGMSRSYDTGKVKEKLNPAISELEAKDYLVPQTAKQRYIKKGPGKWRVRFERATVKAEAIAAGDAQGAINGLVERGVTRKTAVELTNEFGVAAIEAKIDVLDWMLQRETGEPRNPAGFLIESIRNDYAPPSNYQTQEQRQKVEKKKARRKAEVEDQRQRLRQQEQEEQARREHIKSVRSGLSASELQSLKQDAITGADETGQATLQSRQFGETYLEVLVDELILQRYPLIGPVAE